MNRPINRDKHLQTKGLADRNKDPPLSIPLYGR
jgi:hypothetical protein